MVIQVFDDGGGHKLVVLYCCMNVYLLRVRDIQHVHKTVNNEDALRSKEF